jgi:hypothetical protein
MFGLRELSYVVALGGGLFLLSAAAVWWRVYTEASEAKAREAGIDSRLLGSAAILTSVAFGLTGVAAILAVIGWFAR